MKRKLLVVAMEGMFKPLREAPFVGETTEKKSWTEKHFPMTHYFESGDVWIWGHAPVRYSIRKNGHPDPIAIMQQRLDKEGSGISLVYDNCKKVIGYIQREANLHDNRTHTAPQ